MTVFDLLGQSFNRFYLAAVAQVPNLLEAWQLIIRPTLADLVGDAWFLSTPRGNNGFRTLYNYGGIIEGWTAWKYPTSANPFIRPGEIEAIREPWMHISIFTPADYIGPIMDITTRRRGEFIKMEYLDEKRVLMEYFLPLSEMIVDYYDQLKSATRGYASLDYRFEGYRPSDLVKLDILVNGEPVDALSFIIHKDYAQARGRVLADRMRELIPRQLFEVVIQAAIGSKVIARERIAPLRKAVTAKCYGGDITRKRKLLAKQAEGKRRMKQVGRVEIPQEAFRALLTVEDK